MTLLSSRDYDPQSFGHVLAQLAAQINSEKSTTLLVSRHYDKESIPLMLKRVVDAVNANYSGSIIASRHYDDQFIGSVLKRCVDKVNGGAGGGTPDWVPNNAKIFIDLVNNRAWTEADGIVAIDTLLGTDPNTQNGIGTSLYDPAKLTVDGYADASAFPALIGGARAAIVAGATLRYSTKAIGVDDQSPFFAFVSADGRDGVDVDTNSTLTNVYSYGGPAAQADNTKRLNSGVIGAISAIAFTVTATRLEATVNGAASPIALTLNDTTDRPSGNPLVAAAIVLNSDVTALQTITIYDALPDTTGLSALSETGV